MYLLMDKNEAVYKFDINCESNHIENCRRINMAWTLSVPNMERFLTERISDVGFYKRHKNNLKLLKELNSGMCKKEVIATISNYTSDYDKLWVKEEESVVDYVQVYKRLDNCKMDYDSNSLYVNCGKNSSIINYEHLLRLEGIKLFFTVEKEINYFKDLNIFQSVEGEDNVYEYIGNKTKPEFEKLLFSKLNGTGDICSFHIDELKRSIVLDEVLDKIEYDFMVSNYGSLANIYANQNTGKNRSILKNISTTNALRVGKL